MQEVQKAIDREYPYFQHHIESIKSKIKMTTDDLANSLLSFPKDTPVVFKYNYADYYAIAYIQAGEESYYKDVSADLEIANSALALKAQSTENTVCIISLKGKL